MRDPEGTIRPNGNFPDMASLTAYIHSFGLKASIYSGPGPLTCAKLAGHEAADAQQYSKWGFDLLKYDWCSYRQVAKDRSLPELQKPYILMSSALQKQDRDEAVPTNFFADDSNPCQRGTNALFQDAVRTKGLGPFEPH